MLKPSMQDLMKKVNNRYLLVNLAAQRARDIAEDKDYEIPNPDEKHWMRLQTVPLNTVRDRVRWLSSRFRPSFSVLLLPRKLRRQRKRNENSRSRRDRRHCSV